MWIRSSAKRRSHVLAPGLLKLPVAPYLEPFYTGVGGMSVYRHPQTKHQMKYTIVVPIASSSNYSLVS